MGVTRSCGLGFFRVGGLVLGVEGLGFRALTAKTAGKPKNPQTLALSEIFRGTNSKETP